MGPQKYCVNWPKWVRCEQWPLGGKINFVKAVAPIRKNRTLLSPFLIFKASYIKKIKIKYWLQIMNRHQPKFSLAGDWFYFLYRGASEAKIKYGGRGNQCHHVSTTQMEKNDVPLVIFVFFVVPLCYFFMN